MLNYLTRRVFLAILTLLVITCLIYALIRSIPGTPLTSDIAELPPDKQFTPDQLEELERIYGLDKPWYEAYVYWLGNALRGDLGRSFKDNQRVTKRIGERLPATLALSATSLILSYILSIPLGLYASSRSGKVDERVMSTLLYMLYAVPTFVAGLLLLSVFQKNLAGTIFHLQPGMVSPNHDDLSWWGQTLDILKHMILPVVTSTYGSLAYYSRFIKSNMEEVVRQDYIRTARAKGVSRFNVIVHHAFRNTLIPFVTMIGLTLPALVGGSIVIERVFNWPGIGTLFLEAISGRDYTVIMGLTLMFSSLTLLGQLLADILYAFVDPRISYH